MYDSLYCINGEEKLETILIKFKSDIKNFLSTIEYNLSTIKSDTVIKYTYINYDNIDTNDYCIHEFTDIISNLIIPIGISIDFKNKTDMARFMMLFYTGDI